MPTVWDRWDAMGPEQQRDGFLEQDAALVSALEAAVRMIAGRLRPEFTPAGLSVKGNVTLDRLRLAFPGF